MVIERKINKVVNFATLKPGDCFDSDGFVYIKMMPVSTYDMEGEHTHNAFWINESRVFHFKSDDKVTPLNMKLVEV